MEDVSYIFKFLRTNIIYIIKFLFASMNKDNNSLKMGGGFCEQLSL